MPSAIWVGGALVAAASIALPSYWRTASAREAARVWTRTIESPSVLQPGDATEAAIAGRDCADKVVDGAVAESLYREGRFYGLSLLQNAVCPEMVKLMRADSLKLHQLGRLTPSGDPDEPQLSEQYKKYFGSLPVLTILKPEDAAAEGLLGLAFGGSFLSGLCLRIGELTGQTLEPGTLQLACYDGEGVSYQVHEDYVPKEDYDPERLPEHHRFSYKRRITIILYLQDQWSEGLGGAFRAHAVRPEGEPDLQNFVDVLPDGGSLVMFRSDMPHEVLPTFGQRFALSMWCHAG